MGGGSSDFVVHDINSSGSLAGSRDDVDSLREKHSAGIAGLGSGGGIAVVPVAMHRPEHGNGHVRSSSYSTRSTRSARSAASDPFGDVHSNDEREHTYANLGRGRNNAERIHSGGDPFTSPTDTFVGTDARQVPVQLFMPSSSVTSSPRPGIPRDVSTSSSVVEGDAFTYGYAQNYPYAHVYGGHGGLDLGLGLGLGYEEEGEEEERWNGEERAEEMEIENEERRREKSEGGVGWVEDLDLMETTKDRRDLGSLVELGPQ